MENDKLNVIGASDYESVRSLCHRIKEGDREAIALAGRLLQRRIPDGAVLVPAPGHLGYASHTRLLADSVRDAASREGRTMTVFDCLGCAPHEPLYDLKKAGKDVSETDLDVRFRHVSHKRLFTRLRRSGRTVVLLDNVVDTGKTALSCLELLGTRTVAAVGDSHRRNGEGRP